MGGPIRLLPTAYILEFAESLLTDVIKVLFISRFNVLFLETILFKRFDIIFIEFLSCQLVQWLLFFLILLIFILILVIPFHLIFIIYLFHDNCFFLVCLAILSLSLSHTYTYNIYFHVFDIKFEILAVLKCFLSAN